MLAMLDSLSNVDLLSFDIILQPLAHDQCVLDVIINAVQSL